MQSFSLFQTMASVGFTAIKSAFLQKQIIIEKLRVNDLDSRVRTNTDNIKSTCTAVSIFATNLRNYKTTSLRFPRFACTVHTAFNSMRREGKIQLMVLRALEINQWDGI